MDISLTLNETRVLGCLMEKEVTTPDQYPLTLNALTNACNQKSNREPVLLLGEGTVQETLDNLTKKHFVVEKSGFGSRVAKYQQRFAGTEFSEFNFNQNEAALICLLFLRGPQTAGELRSRAHRLSKFGDVQEVEATLKALMAREDGPFVTTLPRESGRRESRYAHLFSGMPEVSAEPKPETIPASRMSEEDHVRLAVLEKRVEELAGAVEELRRRIDAVT